ncbi:hypothetical protein Tco_1067380 [Tanacetum coccineum]|uniref:Uncharacterized protein n=1 Tax=Tanacetum coccineum TaxID=301880 RepID=A0ABQ5HCX7_9ASTR
MIVDQSLEMIEDESLEMIKDESLDMTVDEKLNLDESSGGLEGARPPPTMADILYDKAVLENNLRGRWFLEACEEDEPEKEKEADCI